MQLGRHFLLIIIMGDYLLPIVFQRLFLARGELSYSATGYAVQFGKPGSISDA